MNDSHQPDDLQAELIKDFILESVEGLEQFDQHILEFEEERDLDTMNGIFRVIHTIKGTAGCLALNNIESIAHSGENLLSLIREEKVTPCREMISCLLKLSDTLKACIQCLEETGMDSLQDYSELLAELERHQQLEEDLETSDKAAFGLFEEEPSLPEEAPDAAARDVGPSHAAKPLLDASSPGCPASSSLAESSIRISVNHLDQVMNMVGELVLARNQIVLNTTNLDQAALITASQRLNIITTELQESIMKTRMQPIGNVWTKFPRVVRDVSNELGKQVRLIMDGQDTELDRTIIAAIKDPLTHIVRNAIDHGIETPDKREAAGKPREGMLSLRAYHEGGQIIIEIMDDGAGIDLSRVRAKAVSKNLLSHERAKALSDKEAISLIFLPGFSTSDSVSNVSGRGVGMDVVRSNIEKTGGSVDISSERGQGTTIKIKIPLTLAIIPALTVNTDGERYAIPQMSLLELVRLEGQQAVDGIEELYGTPIYRLRGKLLPLVFLGKQLKTAHARIAQEDTPIEDRVVNIIVLQADGRQFGLVVDEILDTEEIVVKPLGKQLKGISCFAGATIMGDGKVSLILDVLGLAQHAQVVSSIQERSRSEANADKGKSEAKDTQALLIFNLGDSHRMAIPLAQASRLEEFSREDIEYSGDQLVVQYRNEILPLVKLAAYAPSARHYEDAPLPELLQVIVYESGGERYGLIVHEIEDIVEDSVSITRKSDTPTLRGSIVLQGKITDLLNIEAIIDLARSQPQRSIAKAS